MTRYVEHLADAWAEYWSGDDDPVGLIYARDVEWWLVERGRGAEAVGHAGLADARAGVYARARGFTMQVQRIVSGEPWIAVEMVVTATDDAMRDRFAAPGCVWWRVGDDGRITHEHWYWDWDRRRLDDGTAGGHEVGGRGLGGAEAVRTPRWYRDFVHEVLAAWDDDPAAMVDTFYATGVVFDTMGGGPDLVIRGAGALRQAEARLAETLVERRSRVGGVAGDGPMVACTHLTEARTADGPRSTTPVARVWTLDADDRIVGDHTYLLRAWPLRGRR